jgi:hypothetical protein
MLVWRIVLSIGRSEWHACIGVPFARSLSRKRNLNVLSKFMKHRKSTLKHVSANWRKGSADLRLRSQR